MMKSLLAANRSEKDSFRIPHSVQQSIPVRRIFTDGIWQVGQKCSKTWRFSDINYAASSLDDRRSIFRSYGAVLNSLPTDATAKITIINRRLNPVDFQRTMLMPECSDGLDYYRGEYNQIILDKAAESNNLVQEKYVTLSIGLRKIEQTRAYFRRVDIRERNDRPKDRQPKHQVTSTVQRQIVQKFVKELNDSAKQPDRSDSAERTATEQVEMTTREIVHEAAPFPRKAHHRTNAPHTRPERPQPQSIPTPTPQEQGRCTYVQRAKKSRTEKPSARDNLYTKQPEIRLADSAPQKEVPAIREKPKAPEIRSQVHSKTTPAKPSAVRHGKRPDTWTPRSATAPVTRDKEQPIRERPAVTQTHDLPPMPQEQAQQAFMERQTQLSQNPSIESIYPSEPATPVPPQLPVSDAPAITPKRQPLTAGSGKSAPPVQPLAEHPPTIREKPKPTAAPRENPGATFLFGQEIQSKSRLQRRSQKRLYQKLIQSVREKQLHRMHSERCLKRAIIVRSEQPPQPRKSWPKPRQRPSRS